MKLRSALTIVMAAVGGLAAAVAVALIALTSVVHRAVVTLDTSVERVRLLMELESFALQQLHQAEPVDGQTIRASIDQLSETASPEFAESAPQLAAAFEALATPGGIDRQSSVDAAIGNVRRIVAQEAAEAHRATISAASWNRLANITGLATMIVLLVGVGCLLRWLWRSALEPLVSVTTALEQFACGDHDVRAPEAGPIEIREIGASFNRMAAAIQRHHEQQLAFVGGVAHDLRGPLNVVLTGMALLEKGTRSTARTRERIRRQVQYLERMIEDLVDRTRIEAGHLELRREPHDLRDIVVRVVRDQQALAEAHVLSLLHSVRLSGCVSPDGRGRLIEVWSDPAESGCFCYRCCVDCQDSLPAHGSSPFTTLKPLSDNGHDR